MRRATAGVLLVALATPARAADLLPTCAEVAAEGARSAPLPEDALSGFVKDRVLKAFGDAGDLAGKIDSVTVDPLVTYFTTPDAAVGPALAKFLEGGVKLAFPATGAFFDAGRFLIGGAVLTVEEVLDVAGRGQRYAILFGRDPEAILARSVLEQAGTWKDHPAVRARGITAANLGERIKDQAEFDRLWSLYEQQVKGGPGGLDWANTKPLLDEVRADLLKYWKVAHTTAAFDRFRRSLEREKRAYEAQQKAGGSDTVTAPPAGPDLSGTWKIANAANPDRPTSYTGTVQATRQGGAYRLRWTIGGISRDSGVGIPIGNRLAVGYSSTGTAGVAVYRVCGNTLAGVWTHPTHGGRIGRELLQRSGIGQVFGTGGLPGTYAIVDSNNPGTGAYQGKVTIGFAGGVYQVGWDFGSSRHSGVGLAAGDLLIVGWAADGKAGVVDYTFEPGRLMGRWTLTGSTGQVGREMLVR